jgi:hypothetical protein
MNHSKPPGRRRTRRIPAHAQLVLDQIEAARQRPGGIVLYLNLCCSTNDCPIRHFSVILDFTLSDTVRPPVCSNCRRFAELDGDDHQPVENCWEREQRLDREARQRVWRQILRHREGVPEDMTLTLPVSHWWREIDIAHISTLLRIQAEVTHELH